MVRSGCSSLVRPLAFGHCRSTHSDRISTNRLRSRSTVVLGIVLDECTPHPRCSDVPVSRREEPSDYELGSESAHISHSWNHRSSHPSVDIRGRNAIPLLTIQTRRARIVSQPNCSIHALYCAQSMQSYQQVRVSTRPSCSLRRSKSRLGRDESNPLV